jgi:uroporphyrin-III C-methyltransferase
METPITGAYLHGTAPAPGRVALVGAGPGDPELLTLRALRRIAEADAIVHDALVSDAIRALFPPGCAVYDVGKRAGSAASTPQDEINRLLLRLSRQGLCVVRLKGGDPLLFARGGEEALALRAAGIACEVVPGISAAHGASAAAGIPLTHRGLSRSCTLLDGHGPHLDSIDWPALVALGGTWAFFMAARSTQEIAARLLAHGADPALPLALVQGATLPAQRVAVRPLAAVAREGLPVWSDAPGLVLVGPTVELAGELAGEPAGELAGTLAAPLATLNPFTPERDVRPGSDLAQAGR